jgi:hypothetical protein
MQRIANRGGIRLKASEVATTNFLMVLGFFVFALIPLALYKGVHCLL